VEHARRASGSADARSRSVALTVRSGGNGSAPDERQRIVGRSRLHEVATVRRAGGEEHVLEGTWAREAEREYSLHRRRGRW
jgi:hypothetical protein